MRTEALFESRRKKIVEMPVKKNNEAVNFSKMSPDEFIQFVISQDEPNEKQPEEEEICLR